MQAPAYREIRVKTPQGYVYALVDPEDYERLGRYRWHLSSGYPTRRTLLEEGLGRKLIRMHRDIMGLRPGAGSEVDHINRNRLDNRRSNLRIVDRATNARNLSKQAGCSSRHRGVTWSKRAHKWQAIAWFEAQNYYLGLHVNEDDAGRAINAFWMERGYEAPNLIPSAGPESSSSAAFRSMGLAEAA